MKVIPSHVVVEPIDELKVWRYHKTKVIIQILKGIVDLI